MILQYVIHLIASMIGTIAFSILFYVPKKQYLYCGLTGAIGWIIYCALNDLGFSLAFSNFIATLVLTVFSRAMAIIRKTPITVFLVPGIFPLVPGAGIYYTAYYIFMNNPQQAGVKALETVTVAGAITLGILIGSIRLSPNPNHRTNIS
ncbi:MAG: threonine/serine exporter family protein [Clostridiales bacterium]|nr:threonine/serine exporter family protein [Clostridiales bacterium]